MNNPKIEHDPADAGDAALLSYEQVLYVIGYGKDPTKIATQVQRFLQHNPNLFGTAKAAIYKAVDERNEVEKQKRAATHGAKRMRLDLDQDSHERPWLQLREPNLDLDNIPAMLTSKPADVLKWICLSRQSLEKIESGCAHIGQMRKLLTNCLVRVSFNGENLVEQIRDIEERVQFSSNIHFERRLLVAAIGYFEFRQISDLPPTNEEIQQWIQRRRLPEASFLRSKIDKLRSVLGDLLTPIQVEADRENPMNEATMAQSGGEGTSSTAADGGGKQKEKQQSEQNKEIKKIVHDQDSLIQALLPSEQFQRILAVHDKFAVRADTAIGCWMAYRILGEPENKVHIDEITKIHPHSVQFKHRSGAIEFANIVPVVEQRDVDDDVFGNWLEAMENWNEPLPRLDKLVEKQQIALDVISQTLQTAPPLDTSAGYAERDLLVRPEQIGQLLWGLDQREFAAVISGMFVTVDFTGLNYSICRATGVKGNKNLKQLMPIPIYKVTYDAPTATPVPFLPANCTSNARLHIDPKLYMFERGNKSKQVTALPIPQTEAVLDLERFKWCRWFLRQKMDFAFPNMQYVETKVKRLWHALEKTKTSGAQQEPVNACVTIKREQ